MRVRRLDDNHDWTFGRGRASYASGADALRQCLITRLRSLHGDWFLNPDSGVRWFDYLAKNADLRALEAEIKGVVLDTDGVQEISAFALSLNHDTRHFSLSLTCLDNAGRQQEIALDASDN